MNFIGPSKGYQGSSAWFLLSGLPEGSPSDIDRIYFPAPPISPLYTLSYYGPNGVPMYWDDNVNENWYTVTDSPLWLRVTFLSNATFGPLIIDIPVFGSSPSLRTSGASPAPQVLHIPINVVMTPSPIIELPVPGYNTWEYNMVMLAEKWGSQILNWPTNGLGESNWYYDLGRVFFHIQDHTFDNKYRAYAIASLDSYIKFINDAGGALQGYCVFSRGLRMAYQRTGDAKYVKAWELLRETPWVKTGGSPDPQFIRETAYAAAYWIENEKFGNNRNPLVQKACDFLIGHLDCLFRQELGKATNSPINQPFFAGLAMEALIDWYDLSWDGRVVDIVRDTCEYIWNHGVDQNTGGILYDLWRPQAADNPYYCSLNNLIVPAFAWLYHITGDQIHAERADFLFLHFDNLEGIEFSSKVFAQNYRWSFDYFRWRGASI